MAAKAIKKSPSPARQKKMVSSHYEKDNNPNIDFPFSSKPHSQKLLLRYQILSAHVQQSHHRSYCLPLNSPFIALFDLLICCENILLFKQNINT